MRIDDEHVERETRTTDANRLAGLVGPTLIAVTASEALNYHIFESNIPAVTYFNGTVLFVAGLALARAYHRWTRGWQVLITLIGFGTMIGGLARMFAPEAQQPQPGPALYSFLGLGFLAGCYVTFKALATRSR